MTKMRGVLSMLMSMVISVLMSTLRMNQVVYSFTTPISNINTNSLIQQSPKLSFIQSKSKFNTILKSSENDGVKDEELANNKPKNIYSSASSTVSSKSEAYQNQNLNKDIVIIGGGLAGLSTAFYLACQQNNNNDTNTSNNTNNTNDNNTNNTKRKITIYEKQCPNEQKQSTTAASFAAAGMLAPNSERLPSGSLLELCLQSRDLYSEFCCEIETVASRCSSTAAKDLLWSSTFSSTTTTTTNADGNTNKANDDEEVVEEELKDGLQPWQVGYVTSGGFIAPAFAGDSIATWSPPTNNKNNGGSGGSKAIWLDKTQIHEMEPLLHPNIIGGWWFPEDASVDARRLTCSLRAACVELGVEFEFGDGFEVQNLELFDNECKSITLSNGQTIKANQIVLSNGSWMRKLLPVPVTPHKGQSFSLRTPPDQPHFLKRVLFAQDTYIVPKADGRIIVGATVEVGTFDGRMTPKGMMHCMSNALELIPSLGDLEIEESWAGLRPTTPDKGPILGRTQWKNLVIAGGYWRNGVLLAPKTGQLIGDLVLSEGSPLSNPKDEELLQAFSWDRFIAPGRGKELAANTRYAASMHPVQTRSSGIGVAAAVGTELGFYSTAASATEERKRDRELMMGDGGSGGGSTDGSNLGDTRMSNSDEDIFEQAANLGKEDAAYFTYTLSDEKKDTPATASTSATTTASDSTPTIPATQESDDTTTDTTKTIAKEDSSNIQSIYQQIQANKAKSGPTLSNDETEIKDERPDPGFRIYHVDSETGQLREVPPFTSPHIFEAQIAKEKVANTIDAVEEGTSSDVDVGSTTSSATSATISTEEDSSYDETTYDGYQTIQNANSRGSREEELDVMRKARIANRMKSADMSKVGVYKVGDDDKNDDDDDDDGSSSSNFGDGISSEEMESFERAANIGSNMSGGDAPSSGASSSSFSGTSDDYPNESGPFAMDRSSDPLPSGGGGRSTPSMSTSPISSSNTNAPQTYSSSSNTSPNSGPSMTSTFVSSSKSSNGGPIGGGTFMSNLLGKFGNVEDMKPDQVREDIQRKKSLSFQDMLPFGKKKQQTTTESKTIDSRPYITNVSDEAVEKLQQSVSRILESEKQMHQEQQQQQKQELAVHHGAMEEEVSNADAGMQNVPSWCTRYLWDQKELSSKQRKNIKREQYEFLPLSHIMIAVSDTTSSNHPPLLDQEQPTLNSGGEGDVHNDDGSRSMQQTQSSSEDTDITPRTLSESLNVLRTMIAKELKLDPRHVFNDATIHVIKEKKPSTLKALLQCYGIDKVRCKLFGQDILDIVAQYPDPVKRSLFDIKPGVEMKRRLHRKPPSDFDLDVDSYLEP